MAEIERIYAELVLKNDDYRGSKAEMDYSLVRLPRFLNQKEKSQPPQEKMTKLEATMANLERIYAEDATS